MPDAYTHETVERVLSNAIDEQKIWRIRSYIFFAILIVGIVSYRWRINDISWFDVGQVSIFPILYELARRAEIKKYREALHFARTNEDWRRRAGRAEARQT